jgi:hypothetical protein
MMISRRFVRRALIAIAILIVPIGVGYAGLAALRANVCLTESEQYFRSIQGGDFHVVRTDCDTLAKEEFVSVYASKSDPVLPSWLNKETLLFRFYPDGLDDPMPTVRESGNHRILISVPIVESAFIRENRWGSVEVDYEIGKTTFPKTVEIKPSR